MKNDVMILGDDAPTTTSTSIASAFSNVPFTSDSPQNLSPSPKKNFLLRNTNTAWNSNINQAYIYPALQLVIGLGLLACAGLIAAERLDKNPLDFSEHNYLGGNDPVVAALIAMAGAMLVVAACAHWAKRRVEDKGSFNYRSLSGIENQMMAWTGALFVALGVFGLATGIFAVGHSHSDFGLSGATDMETKAFYAIFAVVSVLGIAMISRNAKNKVEAPLEPLFDNAPLIPALATTSSSSHAQPGNCLTRYFAKYGDVETVSNGRLYATVNKPN